MVESTNKVFRDQRELPILDVLDSIWQYVMDIRCTRYIQALQQPPQIHTPYAHQQLLCNQRCADANTVLLSSHTSGSITQRNNKIFSTDLWYRTCTCAHFQSNGIPCGHAFTLIHKLQSVLPAHASPRDYVPYYFTTLAWQQTYEDPLASISLTDLKAKPLGDQVLVTPKVERKIMGRPKVKRMVAGESKRHIAKVQAALNGTEVAPNQGAGSQSCILYGKYGHNRRSCEVEI